MSEPVRGGLVRPPSLVRLQPGEGVWPVSLVNAEARRLFLGNLADTALGWQPALDPRWEWIDVTGMDGRPEYVQGACRHLTPAEVRSIVTDELLAHLCPDCDAQLPA